MADTELYARFCRRLGETPDSSETDCVMELLDEAEDAVLDLIGRDVMPERLVSVQVELAVIAYNKRGAEGQSSRSEGGISISFEDVPPLMRKRLENYPKKARSIRRAHNETL